MKIIPISKEQHADWSYVGLSDYIHTKNDAISPILIAEIDKIILTNPIVFIGTDNKLGLYSLQSLFPDINLMINYKKSTKIFDKNSDLSSDMKRVFEFLKSIEQNEKVTQKALKSIQNAEVTDEWTLSVKLQDGEKKMSGLQKVNIEKLKSLPGDKLLDLNKTGGLDLCFANILSLNNLEKLKQILISKSKSNQSIDKNNDNKSIRDLTLEKQSKEKKIEMDNLVQNLLLDDEI